MFSYLFLALVTFKLTNQEFKALYSTRRTEQGPQLPPPRSLPPAGGTGPLRPDARRSLKASPCLSFDPLAPTLPPPAVPPLSSRSRGDPKMAVAPGATNGSAPLPHPPRAAVGRLPGGDGGGTGRVATRRPRGAGRGEVRADAESARGRGGAEGGRGGGEERSEGGGRRGGRCPSVRCLFSFRRPRRRALSGRLLPPPPPREGTGATGAGAGEVMSLGRGLRRRRGCCCCGCGGRRRRAEGGSVRPARGQGDAAEDASGAGCS